MKRIIKQLKQDFVKKQNSFYIQNGLFQSVNNRILFKEFKFRFELSRQGEQATGNDVNPIGGGGRRVGGGGGR